MVKTPYQFRYYGDFDERNCPIGLTLEQLTNSNIFSDNNKHFITQIGIQGTPGIHFKLNNSANWIELGKTGIYELDLEEKGFIDSISFEKTETIKYNNPETNDFFLFIDILYKDQETTMSQEEFQKESKDYYLTISGGDANKLQENGGKA